MTPLRQHDGLHKIYKRRARNRAFSGIAAAKASLVRACMHFKLAAHPAWDIFIDKTRRRFLHKWRDYVLGKDKKEGMSNV